MSGSSTVSARFEQLGQAVGQPVGERDLDEHDRLVLERGVEERVAALVAVEAMPKVVPAGDGVDRLGRHQPLEHRRRRVPGDLAQPEQPDVEQRREVPGELVVEQAEGRVLTPQRQEVGAQLDQEAPPRGGGR